MLCRFLRDRFGLIAAFYINTGLLLALIGLALGRQVMLRAHYAYAFVLATTVLIAYLAIDLLRWWPFASRAQELIEGDADPAGLPDGGTLDQVQAAQLLSRVGSRAVAERLGFQEANLRHLRFISIWVHQMKTPVSAISLIAQRARIKPPAELPEAMESVEEETAKLAEGLELVLSMARLEEFALDLKVEKVDLAEAVRRVINQRRKQFIRLAIYPEVDAPDGDWLVLTDAKWNSFVIDQIVSNALKYGSQGGPAGQRLRFSLRRTAGGVALSIADQGPGIPLEDLPRIFEPFFTGVNGRRFADATGIGLFVVKEITSHLGHSVAVVSAPGQGTAVTLTYALQEC